ncbi:MAG TPA: FAD-binding and (Fe-S)-binding domain-containing protein [Acidisarcina sp.]
MAASPFTILRAHSHEDFCDARELERRLAATVTGEVRFDDGSRALYATDASNYRQVPIAVVVPRNIADVEATLKACHELGAPVLARGAGTSLAGQCCNVAVVLDFSMFMNSILALDPAAKTARVEPGIVLDRVRDAAELHRLTFAPDPATHNRCTIGGMIGNNSCGVHGLLGGKTVDNIESLDLLLYDGTRMTVGATSEAELAAIVAGGGRRGQIYSGLRRIRDTYSSQIRERFPRISRRVSGYNLDELLPENGFNVARALVGSEGTCATVLSATLHLTDSPPHRRLVVLAFADAFIAADHVPFVLEHKPIGLEGFDGVLCDYMQRKQLAVEDIQLLPAPPPHATTTIANSTVTKTNVAGYLLVELGAWTPEEADEQAAAMMRAAAALPDPPAIKLYTAADAPRIWRIRESALGATVFVPGEDEGWEGWEDAAVPPARLGSYLRQLYALMREYDYRSPLYGHFGEGCVHLRINFDLESAAGIARYREFIDRAADIVIAHGGSISGEHGDGQARAALLPKMFGAELMNAFREFKALWDPDNKMNPGKLIDPVAVYEPQENLRLGAGYVSHQQPTHFQYPDDHGSLSRAALRCVGVGACRKQEGATMCPSYMVTHEERHSTRGRAHLLWEVLEGNVLSGGFQNEAVHEALDLCLSCKACKSECPVGVDVATYKAEFLAHHYSGRRRPLRHYVFGFMDRWAALATSLPGAGPALANLTMQTPLLRRAIDSVAGIAPARSLPRFASQTFQQQPEPVTDWSTPPVILWPDTWNNYFHPQTLAAARSVLRDAGFRAVVPPGHVCCGRPLYDFGFLTEARRYLERILKRFATEIDAGLPFIMLEPSCASVFRDEMVNFFPTGQRARRLRSQTFLLSEFLARHAPAYRPPQMPGRQIVAHGHCHHKSLMKMDDEIAILRATGAEVTLLDSGCCGMAGPFGFEKEKFEVSQALGERVLLPAVRAAAAGTLIVSDGFSCREQIAQNSPRRAVHFAEVIANPE